MNLFVNYYLDQSAVRQQELDDCIVRNSAVVDRMIIIAHQYDIMHLCDVLPGRDCVIVMQRERPSFNDFFKLTQWHPDDYNIISNLDIVFEERLKIQLQDYYSIDKTCMALSRWDSETQLHKNAHGSQDSWIFCGAVPFMEGADIQLGNAGCDNKIAWIIEQNGYKVINPSKTIKCMHVHESGIRNYNVNEDRKKILPPFKIIHPTVL